VASINESGITFENLYISGGKIMSRFEKEEVGGSTVTRSDASPRPKPGQEALSLAVLKSPDPLLAGMAVTTVLIRVRYMGCPE
jgi:hypothetical protein